MALSCRQESLPFELLPLGSEAETWAPLLSSLIDIRGVYNVGTNQGRSSSSCRISLRMAAELLALLLPNHQTTVWWFGSSPSLGGCPLQKHPTSIICGMLTCLGVSDALLEAAVLELGVRVLRLHRQHRRHLV